MAQRGRIRTFGERSRRRANTLEEETDKFLALVAAGMPGPRDIARSCAINFIVEQTRERGDAALQNIELRALVRAADLAMQQHIRMNAERMAALEARLKKHSDGARSRYMLYLRNKRKTTDAQLNRILAAHGRDHLELAELEKALRDLAADMVVLQQEAEELRAIMLSKGWNPPEPPPPGSQDAQPTQVHQDLAVLPRST